MKCVWMVRKSQDTIAYFNFGQWLFDLPHFLQSLFGHLLYLIVHDTNFHLCGKK